MKKIKETRDFLLMILLAAEFSVDTPLGKKLSRKACPYCGEYMVHDNRCDINRAILYLIENEKPTLADIDDIKMDLGRLGITNISVI